MTTTPTTRGYFGSAFFSNGYFGTDYWKERVPVPAPVVTTGALGGIGGGKGLMYEELPSSVWAIDQSTTTFATALVGKLKESHDRMERILPRDPLSRPRHLGETYDLREKVKNYREKASDLEKSLKEANAKVAIPWKLLEEARTEISRLRAMAADQDAELQNLQRTIERQAVDLSEVKVMLGAMASIQLPPFEEVWAKTLADLPTLPSSPPPITIPWVEILGAAAGFAFTALVIPDDWPVARTVGYAASSALVLAAGKKMFS